MTEDGGVLGYLKSMNQHAQEMHGELRQHLIEMQREQERLRGIKYVRLPLIQATGSATLIMGGDSPQGGSGQLATPDQGYIWHIRHLVVEGMTASATPDIINILRGGRIVWQLNGNQFAQTFGRGEMRLFPGESLQYKAGSTFASTAQIIAHGTAEEVPGEMEGKLR
jgi:hypothetical protein